MNKHFSIMISCPHAVNTIAAVLLIVCSCTVPVKRNEPPDTKKAATNAAIIKKPSSSFSDTIVIDSKAAVFYSPDSLQMVKIKAVNEKQTFAMLTHDCFYQMQNARTVLKENWPGIKIVEASKARYLLFIKADKSRLCIDLNEKNDICGLFLFDREKAPVLADMPNINTVLGFYFKQ